MLARETVEQTMRAEFEQNYWKLPCASPVYFYIYPNLDSRQLPGDLDPRGERDEHNTKVLTLRLSDLDHTEFISLTVEDSFQCYREMLRARGIPVKGLRPDRTCSESQRRIFHIGELQSVYSKNSQDGRTYFEVQVWEPGVLEPIKERLNTAK
jgi:hypothetical protein